MDKSHLTMHHHYRKYLPLVGEFTAALAMLAILILSFAPVTPANSILSSASADEAAAVRSGWCGGPVSGDETASGNACHACRADGAVLPHAPCAAEPAFASQTDGPLLAGFDAPLRPAFVDSNGTRAPPFSV